MKNFNSLIFGLVVILLLSQSCAPYKNVNSSKEISASPVNKNMVDTHPTPVPTQTLAQIPVLTSTLNETNPPSQTPTFTFQATPTENTTKEIEELCSDFTILGNELEGTLLVYEQLQKKEKLLDLRQLKELKDIFTETYDFTVNKDHSQIAFIDFRLKAKPMNYIGILNSQGVKFYPVDLALDSFTRIYQWMEDGTLFMSGYSTNGDSWSYFFFDPTTGEIELFAYDFPGKKSPDEVSLWTSGPAFDHKLELAVYQRNPGDENNQGRIVLWDLDKNEAVNYFSSSDVYGSQPIWSPTNENFAMILGIGDTSIGFGHQELFVINRRGEVVAETKLSDQLKESYLIDANFTWSPDGGKIAFFVTRDNNSNNIKLYIFNINTQEIFSYCFVSESPRPIWSADNKHIAFRSNNNGKLLLLIININNSKVYQIEQDFTPLAWLDFYPENFIGR